MRIWTRGWAMLLLVALLLTAAAGCAPRPREINVYLSDDQAMFLVPVKRQVSDPSGAVQAVMAGPRADEPGLSGIFPEPVRLLGVSVDGNVAAVDFSAELRDFRSGSAGEIMLIYSVVNTLTEWPGIEAVRFLVAGEPIDTLGHLDLTEPVRRNPDLIQEPIRG